jgi:RNA polymerase sigma-70 factor (ECF subfamily)
MGVGAVDTDGALARLWQGGDARAAARLVDRYTDALGAVAYTILGNAGLAEEAVQEAFSRAAREIGRLAEPGKIGPWLVSIVRHAALDTIRKRGHRREDPLDSHDARDTRDPAALAQRGELAEQIRRAVAALPDHQRDIFAMKYVAGMSYAQVAQAAGITPEAVSQKLWRIRQKLQRELQEFKP